MTNTSTMKAGYAAKRNAVNVIVYIILAVMSVIWIFPILWLILQSFNTYPGVSTTIFPEGITFGNYVKLFTDEQYPYGKQEDER